MYIEQVELKNIGPHQSLTVKFGRGLVGIVGANGAGKSTLVNAIYAALTNDFTRLGGTKAEIITNGSSDPSYIRVIGKHQGQSFTLTRWLRPNKNEFKIGVSVFEKATDVNDAVINYLDISKAVIDKYVFVNQWEMFSFLDQTASERAKTFQYLCGTEAASSIHKVCMDYVARQQSIEVVDNSVELEDAITETRTAMTEHSKVGKAAKLHILTEEELEARQLLLSQYELGKEAQTQLKEVKHKIERLELSLEELQQSQSKHKLARREAWQAKFKNKLAVAQELLDLVEVHKTARLNLFSKKDIHDEHVAVAELKKRSKPKPNKDYVDLKLQKQLTKEKHELEFQIKQVTTLLIHSDNRLCTQCQQEVTKEYVERVKVEYLKNVTRLAEVVRILTYSESYDKKLEQYQAGYKICQQLCMDAAAELEEVEKEVELISKKLAGVNDEHIDTAKALITRNLDIEQQKFYLEKDVKQEQHHIAGFQGELKNVLEQKSKLSKQIKQMPAVDKVSTAKIRLAQHQEALAVWQKSVGAFQEAKRSWLRTKQSLEQLTAKMAEREKVRKLLDTVSSAGDVFHWNNLPKLVSQSNLQLLVGDINANLQMFNDPFYVEADADLTFNVFFAGQEPVKAKQLSGGQKVLLSIAFRAALDRVFGHNIGMMFLDEPTSGLDADNVSFFQEALQQLAKKVGADHQLIVITHVQELGKVFDQLVEIKKGEVC
jgi:DNA repair exonuclease SbcCD ATPase subunit